MCSFVQRFIESLINNRIYMREKNQCIFVFIHLFKKKNKIHLFVRVRSSKGTQRWNKVGHPSLNITD